MPHTIDMRKGIPELNELNEIRLNESLTYRQLATELGLSFRTLHQLLNSDEPKPYDRTLHKIRRFLDQRKADKAANGGTA